MSGTRRPAPYSCRRGTRCHQGRRGESRLIPPPPPPKKSGASFHVIWEAIRFLAFSLRFVPPTAVTNGELAGSLTANSGSAVLLSGVSTGQALEPWSPAATSVEIPAPAATAKTLSSARRNARLKFSCDSQLPSEIEIASGWCPLEPSAAAVVRRTPVSEELPS